MSFTAQDVKAPRDSSGAGMMDRKKALQENDGDIEAAKVWLREKGLAASATREDRDASQGVVSLLIDGNVGGSSARFVNHSCAPNCEALVWVDIDGDERRRAAGRRSHRRSSRRRAAGRGRSPPRSYRRPGRSRHVVHRGLHGRADPLPDGHGVRVRRRRRTSTSTRLIAAQASSMLPFVASSIFAASITSLPSCSVIRLNTRFTSGCCSISVRS